MSKFLNAMVVLFSLCLIVLVGFHEVNLATYLALIMVEYLLVLVLNEGFRTAVHVRFSRKKNVISNGEEVDVGKESLTETSTEISSELPKEER